MKSSWEQNPKSISSLQLGNSFLKGHKVMLKMKAAVGDHPYQLAKKKTNLVCALQQKQQLTAKVFQLVYLTRF